MTDETGDIQWTETQWNRVREVVPPGDAEGSLARYRAFPALKETSSLYMRVRVVTQP